MVPHGIKISHYFSVLNTIWNLGLFDSPLPVWTGLKVSLLFYLKSSLGLSIEGGGDGWAKTK